jgi:hypothetical protein
MKIRGRPGQHVVGAPEGDPRTVCEFEWGARLDGAVSEFGQGRQPGRETQVSEWVATASASGGALPATARTRAGDRREL